jgi:hypothetical protein
MAQSSKEPPVMPNKRDAASSEVEKRNPEALLASAPTKAK